MNADHFYLGLSTGKLSQEDRDLILFIEMNHYYKEKKKRIGPRTLRTRGNDFLFKLSEFCQAQNCSFGGGSIQTFMNNYCQTGFKGKFFHVDENNQMRPYCHKIEKLVEKKKKEHAAYGCKTLTDRTSNTQKVVTPRLEVQSVQVSDMASCVVNAKVENPTLSTFEPEIKVSGMAGCVKNAKIDKTPSKIGPNTIIRKVVRPSS
jgi:hypothetical protein